MSVNLYSILKYLIRDFLNIICFNFVCFSVSDSRFPVALGRNQTSVGYVGCQHATCILCQEEQDVRHNSRAMVLAAYIQRYAGI